MIMALPFAVALPRALGVLIKSFRFGNMGKVSVQGLKVTKVRVNKIVTRSLTRGGFKRAGKVHVNRIVDAVTVKLRATYVNKLDRFLLQLPVQLDKTISEAAELIEKQSFVLVPRDTGRLERTGKIVKTSAKGKVEYTIGYGPAIDPDTGIDYSLFAHFGEYNRGPGTIAKNAEAGPLFLSRPLQTNTKDIISNIKVAVRRAMRVI